MNYLHYEYNLNSDDVVEVTLSKQANVRLLTPTNYQKYKRGQRCCFLGGGIKRSPFQIRPIHSGKWHVAIDLGGGAGSINASVKIIKN